MTSDPAAPAVGSDGSQFERRWWILAVIGVAQLMVVLDTTIVNVALPSAQRALHFSNDNRQWIVTAYALAFGSLLLLGGRIGDLFGRKWTLIGGLVGFSIASAVGGAAGSFGMLVGARAAQGAFAAILAPSALALLSTTFENIDERRKAFGVYGGIAGAGGATGLLIGGVLTQAFSWRLTLFVNLAIALPVALAALWLLVNERPDERPALDLPGTATVSLGLFALVYGFSNAETHSWSDPTTIIALIASAVLLAVFVALESRAQHPLLPLRILGDRARGGSYVAVGLIGAGMFGAFLFLTYFLQNTKGYTPIQTGLAFLPLPAAIVATSMIVQNVLLKRVGPRPLMTFGLLLGAGAMVWLAQLTPSASYGGHVLPALFVLGVGMGATGAPAMFTATYKIPRADTGVASAMVPTMQQVGGAVGASALSTIFASAVSSYSHTHAPGPRLVSTAAVHGYTTAFWVAAAIFAAGAILIGSLVPSIKARAITPKPTPTQPSPRPVAAVRPVLGVPRKLARPER
jgi:EmrB/QacA subfamily drug resistance transporter